MNITLKKKIPVSIPVVSTQQGELLSSMSNPDITVNIDFDSSCGECMPINQNSLQCDVAQNLAAKVVDASVACEQKF
ncbi:hypothetical protein CEXT_154751 [Caerostris extrusa]|uniref:Uncharacterized protein n=1 Tax=Caerostris extrusa TaxID=172846 RepID=A0AAV4M9D1_CAEEX|nr:hypothetical protein CEXT_154751 [Caerostris extrusa]